VYTVLCGVWVAQLYCLNFRPDNRGILRPCPWYGAENFLFSTAFRPAVGPVQWVSGVQAPNVKRSGFDGDQYFLSVAKYKNEWR